ncbi:YitT family protein [Mycoplasma sp. 128]|uniref:YitT family protein n=1 Tax=Mycoplasma sp. 3341 TaxID=3447506 RepID=UPI003F65A67C
MPKLHFLKNKKTEQSLSSSQSKNKKTKEEKRAKKILNREKKQLADAEWKAIMNPYNVNMINVWRKFPMKVIIMFLSAFFWNLAVGTFLGKAAAVSTGVSALTQIITYTMDWGRYFGFFYVLLNLPIIFFFWKRNPRLFMVLTIYWMIFQVIIQLIIGNIKVIDNFIKAEVTIYSPHIDGLKEGTKTYWRAFNYDGAAANGVYDGQTWPIFAYAFIGAALDGLASGIAWKGGGSIAGSNIIIYYISRVKKISVGKVGIIVNLCIATFSTIVLGGLEIGNLIKSRPWRVEDQPQTRFIVRVIATILYIGLYNVVVDKVYPKYKKIKFEIYSTRLEKISMKLRETDFAHSWNIYYGTSGKTHKDIGRIEITSLYLEKDFIISLIHSVDKYAWISVVPISEVKGKFNTSSID